jgi:hypothetical protein
LVPMHPSMRFTPSPSDAVAPADACPFQHITFFSLVARPANSSMFWTARKLRSLNKKTSPQP